MFVSTDGGATFNPGAAISSGLTPIAVAGHEGHLWLPRGSSGLSRSTDSGASFTTLSSVQQATLVAVGKAAPGQSYPAVFIYGQVTNVTGIFRSDDQGASWVRINDDQHQFGLASIHVFCADPRIFGRVYVGTEGRGIIYGDLSPPQLVCSLTNSQMQLSWPLAYSDWLLQAQTNSLNTGLTPNWVTVSGSSGTNRVLIPINPTNGSVFFRLVSP
jgi:hypothetical protein